MMAEKSEDLKKKGISYDDSDDEGDSTCGLVLMKLNLVPRKKLIVLSIGGLGWSVAKICQLLRFIIAFLILLTEAIKVTVKY